MKKIRLQTLITLSLWICLFFSSSFQAQCQEGAQYLDIGTVESSGETTTNRSTQPLGLFYNYSASQTIYTKQELNELIGKQISSISYKFFSTPSKAKSAVRIYIGYTDKDEYSSTDDAFIGLSEQTLVYTTNETSFLFQSLTDAVFEFQTPFFYDGSKNLVVTITRPVKAAQYENIDIYQTDTSSVKRAMYMNNDATPFAELSDIPNDKKKVTTGRANTRFGYQELAQYPIAKVSPRYIDFGNIENGTSSTVEATLSNVGGTNLSITAFEGLDLPFSVTETVESINIEGGKSTLLHFTFAPISEGLFKDTVVLKVNGANAINDTLFLSAFSYPQGSLLEGFEGGTDIPVLFRNRTNQWKIKEIPAEAYEGRFFIKSDASEVYDTLITPKVSGGSLSFMLKDLNYNTKDFKVLYSSDLISYNELKNIEQLSVSTNYTLNQLDLSGIASNSSSVFIAFVGYRMALDNILISNPIKPTTDLYADTLYISNTELNEQSTYSFTVGVKNWGTSTTESFKIRLLDQNSNMLNESEIVTEIAPNNRQIVSVSWTAVAGVESIRAEIILEADKDQTNNISTPKTVNIIPFVAVGNLSPKTIDFNVLASDKITDTAIVTLNNSGIALLTVTELKIQAPFKLVQNLPIKISPKTSVALQIVFDRTGVNPANYSSDMILCFDGIGDSVVALKGVLLKEGYLFESFEGDEFPPFLWRNTSAQWQKHNSSSMSYHGNFSARESSSSTVDTLISPCLKVVENNNLSFYARDWNAGKSRLKVLYSTDLENWTELGSYEGDANGGNGTLNKSTMTEHVIDLPIGTYYIGFAGSLDVLIDYILGPEIKYAKADLCVIAANIPKTAKKNNALKWDITLRNMASNTAENYKVELMKGDVVLYSHEATPEMSIAYKEEKTFEFSYIFLEDGIIEDLYIRVVQEADEDINNNSSRLFTIDVRPENENKYLIGTMDKTSTDGICSSNWKYSLYEMLYYPNELNIANGSNINYISIPIPPIAAGTAAVPFTFNIWIGETQSEELTSWINANSLSLVAAKSITLNPGTSSIDIEFATPYSYSGKNLVLLVEKQWQNSYKSYSQYINFDNSGKRRIYYRVDGSEAPTFDYGSPIPFLPSGNDGYYPTIEFGSSTTPIKISGKVSLKNGEAVENAVASISTESLYYTDTTDAEGSFSIETSNTNTSYIFSIASDLGIFTSREVKVENADLDMGVLSLQSRVFDYTVFAKAPKAEGESYSLSNLQAVLQNTEIENEKFTIALSNNYTKDTASLLFKAVAEGTYNLSIKHLDYSTYTQEVVISNNSFNDTIQLSLKSPISVSGKILSSINRNPLKGAALTITTKDQPSIIVSKDTTDENGMYSLQVSKFGCPYTISLTHPSYQNLNMDVVVWEKEVDTVLNDTVMMLKNLVATISVGTSNSADPTGATVVMRMKTDEDVSHTGNITNGKVVFDNLLPGIYVLTVEKEGYVKDSQNIELISSLNVSVVLSPIDVKTDFYLTVKTNNGLSASGADVYFENNYTGLIFREKVNEIGNINLTDILSGTYTLQVYKKGYEVYINESLNVEGKVYDTVVLEEIVVSPYALDTTIDYNQQTGKVNATLVWNEIGDYYFDSFEEYQDFSIDFKPWTLIDNDKLGTASVDKVSYANMGDPIAAMIFNPFATEPVCTDPAFKPFTGNKYMVFFNSVGGPNDDWAISPKRMVRDGDMLQFVCRQLADGDTKDRITVSVRTSENAEFEQISEGNYLSIGAQLSIFEADLSKYVGKEIQVGIHCISSNTGNMLIIDDFFIGSIDALEKKSSFVTKSAAGEPLYYNVYLDKKKVDTVETTSFTYTNLAAGEHILGVSAVYSSAESSISEITIYVEDYITNSVHLIVNVSTNTEESADKAAVELVSADNIYSYVVSSGKVDIPYFPKGEYTLNIEMIGFEAYTQSIVISADKTVNVVLKEALNAPINPFVVVEVDPGNATAHATFTWNENLGFNESFENFADFSQSLTSWQNIDKDQHPTFGLSNCSFPGAQKAAAAIVFNPWKTTPPCSSDAQILPYQGNKEIMFISSDKGAANDWLVAPKQDIRDNYILKFYAKSYDEAYPESILIWVALASSNGEIPAEKDYVKLSSMLNMGNTWKEYTVDLSDYSGKTIYLAFNYISDNKFFMLMDDVYIGPKQTTSEVSDSRVLNYNVYLNGTLKGKTTSKSFDFTSLSNGSYNAEVEAIYKSGVSDKASYNFKVELAANESDKDLHKIELYPNPVGENKELNIKSDYDIIGISIKDLSGKKQFAKSFSGGITNATIAVDKLRAGAYILEIKTPTFITTRKLIVK